MHKPRLISLRILAVVGFSAVVFFLVLAVGFGGKSSGGGKSTQVAIVTNYLVPGSRLAAGDYAMADTTSWPPKLPTTVASSVTPTFIGADRINEFVGRMLTNSVSPGDLLSEADFFLPRDAASCAADGAALALPSASPTVGASAAPSPSATSKSGTPQAFAYRLTDLLCGDRLAIVLDSDPTAGFARPGDLMDVFLVEGNRGDSATVRVTRMMTRRLLFVVQRIVPNDPAKLNNYTPAGTVYVLDLSAQDVSDVLWAQRQGDVRIAMSRPDACSYDSSVACTDGPVFTDGAIFQSTYVDATPAPSPSPAPLPSEVPIASPEPSADTSISLPMDVPLAVAGLVPTDATLQGYDGTTGSLAYTTSSDVATIKDFYAAWAFSNGDLAVVETGEGAWTIGGDTGLGATVTVTPSDPNVVSIAFRLP